MFGLTLRQKYIYQQTSIAEQKGFLSKEKTTHSFFSVGKFSTGYFERDPNQITCTSYFDLQNFCNPYYQMEMIVSGTALKITREYKGIVESISEVGGMVDLVYLLFAFFYGFYHQHHFKAGLVERIYGFEPQSKSKSQKPTSMGEKKIHPNFHRPNSDPSLVHKLRKEAEKSVESKLDIIQISKELLAVKALAHLLLSSEIRDLLPMFELKVLAANQVGPKSSQAQELSSLSRNVQPSSMAVQVPNLDSSRNSFSRHKPGTAGLQKERLNLEEQIQRKPSLADFPANHQPQETRLGLETSLLSQLRAQIGENIRNSVQNAFPTNEIEIIL